MLIGLLSHWPNGQILQGSCLQIPNVHKDDKSTSKLYLSRPGNSFSCTSVIPQALHLTTRCLSLVPCFVVRTCAHC